MFISGVVVHADSLLEAAFDLQCAYCLCVVDVHAVCKRSAQNCMPHGQNDGKWAAHATFR